MKLQDMQRRYIPMSETMFYILLSLREERHGYGIMQFVRALTSERIILGAGTIYQSLSKLESDGLIQSTREIDRKKLYIITPAGEQVLITEARRIKELYACVEGLL